MAEEFYLKANENAPETGPFSSKKMRRLAAAGQITPETLVRRGESSWVHATSVRGLELPAASTSQSAEAATADQEVASAIPTTSTDDHGISLAPRLTDPTGGSGEAQVLPPQDEPRAFDEHAASPPSITAPPPPPVEDENGAKPTAEISEMIPVDSQEQSSASKAKKKKRESQDGRTAAQGTGGGIAGFFSFDTMIAPSVVKFVYFLCMVLILGSWLGGSVVLLIAGIINQELVSGLAASLGYFVVGGVMALLYLLGLRIVAEAVIAFFRASDDLAAIRASREKNP